MPNATFPDRLHYLRQEVHHWSQEELGHRVGVSRVSVLAWEKGHKVPEGMSLIRLSAVFRVSVDYLLGLTDATMRPLEATEQLQKACAQLSPGNLAWLTEVAQRLVEAQGRDYVTDGVDWRRRPDKKHTTCHT